MPRNPSPDVQQQLQGAFVEFRDALQKLLEDQAQQSVADTLQHLSKQGGPFRVQDAQIEVVIRDLTVAASDQPTAVVASSRNASKARAPRTARRSRTTRGRGGAQRGGVKEAVLTAMGPGEELGIADFETRLQQAGINTTTNNLHQQLRRLVQSAAIERCGRGRYRRVGTGA